MTQEEKSLLLQDLCSRSSYRPNVCLSGKETCILTGIDGDEVYLNVDSEPFHVESIKPYLRPMSSMTEDEANELDVISDGRLIGGGEYLGVLSQHDWTDSFKYILLGIDWLNAHHFDYSGLIEKGLALEAPEGMYNLKGK